MNQSTFWKFTKSAVVFILIFTMALTTSPYPAAYSVMPEEENESNSKDQTNNDSENLDQQDQEEQAAFAPDRIIVEFREEAKQAVLTAPASTQTFQTGNPQLNQLLSSYARSIRQLVPLGMKSTQEKIAETRAKFESRARRTPAANMRPVAELGNFFVVELKELNAAQALEAFKKNPYVVSAEHDYIMKATEVPNDPYYNNGSSGFRVGEF